MTCRIAQRTVSLVSIAAVVLLTAVHAGAAPYRVLVTAEGDSGTSFSDKLVDDGAQTINTIGGGPTVVATSSLSGSQSALYDATGERLEFVGSAAGLGTQFSLGAFVNVATTKTGNMRLFSSYAGSGSVGPNQLLWDNLPNVPVMRFFLDGSSATFPFFPFNTAGPTHIAATVDGNQVSIFINGSQHGTTQTIGDGVFTLTPDLLFGEDTTVNANEQFLGEADDIFLVNRVLTPAEVNQIATIGAEEFFIPFVPEPSTGSIMLLGLAGWLGVRRRRRAA